MGHAIEHYLSAHQQPHARGNLALIVRTMKGAKPSQGFLREDEIMYGRQVCHGVSIVDRADRNRLECQFLAADVYKQAILPWLRHEDSECLGAFLQMKVMLPFQHQ